MNVAVRSHLLQKRLESKLQRKLRQHYKELLSLKRFRTKKSPRIHNYPHMSNDFFDRTILR